MWSLGVVTFFLLTGRPPFQGQGKFALVQKIKAGVPKLPGSWECISAMAKDFVMALLTVDVEKRLSAADALNHAWIMKRKQHAAKIDLDVMKSLQSFSHASRFRRACLLMMAWSLTAEERRDVQEQFQLINESQDGAITQIELERVLRDNVDVSPSCKSEAIETIFHSLAFESNHEISYSAFTAAALQSRTQVHDRALRTAFRRFDQNGSGAISLADMREVVGDSYEGQDVAELMQEAGAKNDGKISYEDFINFLQMDQGTYCQK